MDNRKKINIKKIIVWGINLVLFSAVVFMGVDQAGKGAQISGLETRFYSLKEKNSKLNELLLSKSSTSEVMKKSEELGFSKPERVIYIDSTDSFAALLP